MDLLRLLDLDASTVTLLLAGAIVLCVIVILAVRSVLRSRLAVVVGGALAVGAITPGVLSAIGNLLGGLLSGLLPLVALALGGLFSLLVYLNRHPEMREWLRPLLPPRRNSGLPPTPLTHVETHPAQYIIDVSPEAAPRMALPPAQVSRAPARRRRYLPDMTEWER